MQTFLPYPSFEQSAKVIDYRRLCKQRLEVKQILFALSGQSKGWVNHPATRMWRGYEQALVEYGLIICQEWTWRGYKDAQYEQIAAFCVEGSYKLPHWIGGAIHSEHRAALLLKNYEYYSQYGWTEEPKAQTYWPI